MQAASRRRRRDLRTGFLYSLAIVREFRWTLAGVVLAVTAAALLIGLTPHASLDGARPGLRTALFAGWMALVGEVVLSPPETWYLALLYAIYPLVGFGLIGEGVVRFALLMASRKRGEKEWMRVMATTYRDHVVLCGLGHLGYRVLDQLLQASVPVVAIEKDEGGRFMGPAKATGIPILIRDMKDDEALVEAGVPHARAIVIATNNDMTNIEVALDARRMNPRVRVIMRMFDQQIAGKLAEAIRVDAAFSSSALAAPIVAAMAVEGRVLATYAVAGVPHVAAELVVAETSELAGRTVADIEASLDARIVARVARGSSAPESPPPAGARIAAGDTLVVHASAASLTRAAAASRAA